MLHTESRAAGSSTDLSYALAGDAPADGPAYAPRDGGGLPVAISLFADRPHVREAMRAGDPAQMLRATGAAIEGTTGRPPVRIAVPPEGQREGYPIIELVPHANGMDAAAYHARTGADFVAQTWALMRQEFREGPHDTLGPFQETTLASTGAQPLDLLLDGEPAHGDATETFALDKSPVDLIATLAQED